MNWGSYYLLELVLPTVLIINTDLNIVYLVLQLKGWTDE